jgi:transaldolase
MKATELLHNLGQSLWLDNITRDLLDDGTLERYIVRIAGACRRVSKVSYRW